jgi:hypothetical protein
MNPLMCAYAFALQIAAEIYSAVVAAGAQSPPASMPVTDSLNDPNPANRDYAGYGYIVQAPATWPPPAGYVSIFEARMVITLASGKQYLLQQTLADFAVRQFAPNMAYGDKNYLQQGHGATTQNVPVAGCPVGIQFLDEPGGLGVAQCYWGSPA